MGWDFIIEHTGIWLELWVFLAIILFAVVVIYFVLRRRKLIKTEEELEELLEQKYEREAAEQEGINNSDENAGDSEETEVLASDTGADS